ncbi:hypothetical protein CBW24_04835 [Pacificitalea manganoxidans]|uniref:PhnB-like domain-containing protein n=1 Tax=Pacificitalea manganoxidans TaxID=1411902 RepID=A0A291LXI3_9RHOB|nr:VOC family protein [Pacificitalea manganoxidans]ATI41390.1 hypothetical protein CBW24_04835 [Pacificitalea manganoxidans]MDR6308800.1 PhnB protein [Pacificitalea manganoxidans]
MSLTPYLFFDGDCEEALDFYVSAIGGEITQKMRFSEAPPEAEVPSSDKIMHGALMTPVGPIFASDNRDAATPKVKGMSLSLNYGSVDTARRVFEALAEGGEKQMEFHETFWSPGFGTLTDKFGIQWMVGVGDEA